MRFTGGCGRWTGVQTDSRPVYIESRICVVKEAVMCSFEYLCVVYHTPSLTICIRLNKRLKQIKIKLTFIYRRKVHTTHTFFTPTTHEIRGMRVV